MQLTANTSNHGAVTWQPMPTNAELLRWAAANPPSEEWFEATDDPTEVDGE